MIGLKSWLKAGAAVMVTIMICALISGCWDEVNLQDVSYITAIGIDNKDGQFELYAQQLNFSAVAKTDSPQTGTKKVWIGRANGDSVQMAFNALNRGSYLALNMDHLKSIVVHERALPHLTNILDGLNRQRASRYTSLMYGTSLPIDELFNTETFFEQSPLNSILYLPRPHDLEYTFVKTQTMQSLVQQLKDPAESVLLPALGATESLWKHGKKPMNTQIISGVFVLNEYQYRGYAPEKDVRGIRWVNNNFQRIIVNAEKEGNSSTVAIANARHKISTAPGLGEPARFELSLKLKGAVIELDGELSRQEIEQILEQKIKEEIESAFRYGAARQMDVFNLEHVLYRYHNQYWKQHVQGETLKLMPDQLTVKVDMQLGDSGKFDLSSGGS